MTFVFCFNYYHSIWTTVHLSVLNWPELSVPAGFHWPQHGRVCWLRFHGPVLPAGGLWHQEHPTGQLHTKGWAPILPLRIKIRKRFIRHESLHRQGICLSVHLQCRHINCFRPLERIMLSIFLKVSIGMTLLSGDPCFKAWVTWLGMNWENFNIGDRHWLPVWTRAVSLQVPQYSQVHLSVGPGPRTATGL